MSTRRPAVAGQFYPGHEEDLERMVRQYMDETALAPAPERVAAVVAPHAGYVYSGRTAAFAFARIRGAAPKRVILLGCSHRYPIATASVFDSGSFEIPLGVFPVDEPFAKELARVWESESILPHQQEHTLEVQLPFLWIALGKTPIVPVLFGGPAAPWHEEAGKRLAGLVDDGDLVVTSTDLSHYLADAAAHQIDKRSLDAVLNKDCPALCEGLLSGSYSMCGGAAVVAAMAFAKARGAEAWSLLDYQTSGATSGDFERVVGYAAISMERAS